MSSVIHPELEGATAGALALPASSGVRSKAETRPLPPKPKNARYQSLDMWRGVACLMLVFYHCTFYAEGQWRTFDMQTWSVGALALNLVTRLWVGVPMFFVVSGYCIAASVDSLRRKPHSLTNYFGRRIRRIYPPLWAAFAVAVSFFFITSMMWPEMYARAVQLPNLAELSPRAWLGNLTASESWLATMFAGTPDHLLLNTWTLCYEEQFYFVTGLLLLISARNFFTAAAVVTGIVFCMRPALLALGVPVAGFFFDGHWLMFAMGLLVYQRINYYQGRGRWITWAILGAGIVYGLAMRVLCDDYADRHLGEYIAVAGAFSIALIFLKRWDTQISTHRLVQPLNWCGKISYSIYLTHFPLVIFLSAILAAYGVTHDASVVMFVVPLCLALTLPVGWLFYMAVERHFINRPVATA